MPLEKTKIAILAPLTRPTHPDTRGGRPRVVYDLVVNLKKRNCDVTVYGPGDCQVPTKLIEVIPKSIYNLPPTENSFYQQTIALAELDEKIRQDAGQYDIIHNHVLPEFMPLLVSHEIKTPILTTPHIYIWPELREIFKKFSNTYFVAVSDFQQKQGEGMNFVDRIYSGIEVSEFDFNDKPEDYLLFFGRMKEFVGEDGKKIDPKGVKTAIQIAQKSGMRLKIAGNVESQEFFDQEIKPHLNNKIEFIGPVDKNGPISFKEKIGLYKNAKAFLFPIQYVEAFGITMLEAMACGTPVVGSNIGATNEAIVDGRNGYLAPSDDIDAMVSAVNKIDQIDRSYCRKWVEEKFSAELMAQNYENVYKKIINKKGE